MIATLLGNTGLSGWGLPDTKKSRVYKRYIVTDYRDICIGRSEHNAICYSNKAVSFLHARLSRNGDSWVLYDENSTNGTYVNHMRVWGNYRLKPGDVIEIMALRIVVGKGFFAMNNPEGRVWLDEKFFTLFKRRNVYEKKPEKVEFVKKDCFEPVVCNKIHFFTREQCGNLITSETAGLWERLSEKEDFLKFKVGQEENFIDFKREKRIVVTGRRDCVSDFAMRLLFQMVTCCRYDDLKIIFLWDGEREKEVVCAKWLPHAWDDEKKISFWVEDEQQFKNVVEYLSQEEKKRMSTKKNPPFFVVFAFNENLADNRELHQHLTSKENMSALFFLEEKEQLSRECEKILNITKPVGFMQEEKNTTAMSRVYGENDADLLCLSLANLELDTGSQESRECYLVELYVPAAQAAFVVRLPRYKRIGEILPWLEKEMSRRTDGAFDSDKNAVLCDGEAGIVLNVDVTPAETGILNGTKLMLI